MITALFLHFFFKVTDVLYSINADWSKSFCKNIFFEIALSIALHNIDPEVIDEMGLPKETLPEITLNDFPFCYLLILADNLQEWDRPAKVRPNLPPKKVSISYDHNEERFNVKYAFIK